MNKLKKFQVYLIMILSVIYIFFNENTLFKAFFCQIKIKNGNIINQINFNSFLKIEENEISLVVNMKNLTKNKHCLFYKVIKKLNITRNFYFIKNLGKSLNINLSKLVENSSVKIVQSNFPDSNFLPFIASLYGNTPPEFVLFIEGDKLMDNTENNLIKWVKNAYKKIMINDYDYIFGNSQIIKGKKIGCSLLLSKSSIIEHLLYYTDSDTSHANPFVQLSLATKTKFFFIHFKYIKSTSLDNIFNRFSLNMNCPSIYDKKIPSFCIILPNFKRNYFSSSFTSFS